MQVEVWVLLEWRKDICISGCGLGIGVRAKDGGDALGAQVSLKERWMPVVTSL